MKSQQQAEVEQFEERHQVTGYLDLPGQAHLTPQPQGRCGGTKQQEIRDQL
jgi:hypothetical protein